MPSFSSRVSTALVSFESQLSDFIELVAVRSPDPPRLPHKLLKQLADLGQRGREASKALARSLELIDLTSLDIVDMQVRLQGETARLASTLRELGAVIQQQHFAREAFEDALIALDEAAQLLAAAVFPSAVKGLRAVNVKLWDFEKIQWKRYTDVLVSVIRSQKITPAQEAEVQRLADDVAVAFAEVNTLLNELAESRASDAGVLRARLKQAPTKLTDRLTRAQGRLRPEFDAFAPVIKASRKIAEDVAELLRKLVIPIYPTHASLGECVECVDRELYDNLSGVQMFALLNILARIQSTRASGRPLITGRKVRVTDVFPDRIYLEADRSLIDDMAGDRTFESAPASLHRFKEGSLKQKAFRRGNLQVCFASLPNNRVAVDADIDLYRAVVPHLFGEVLVNHLTGSTTDQYEVRRILDEQRVASVGGFSLLQV